MANTNINPFGNGGTSVTVFLVDNVPTANSNNLVKSGGVYLSLLTEVVEVTTEGSVSQAMDAGKFYKFTGGTNGVSSLTLTLNDGESGYLESYFGKFTTASAGCTLSLPITVSEASSNPTIAGGKTYEFHIIDNVIRIGEV